MTIERNKIGNYLWQGTWMVLPIHPHFNQVTKQIYDRNIFEIMKEADVSFRELKEFIKNWVEFRNTFLVGAPSNNEVYLQMHSQRFAFYIGNERFSLYDDFGRILGDFKIDSNNAPTNEFVKWIMSTASDYCNGILECSDCETKMSVNDTGGRYFAGIYCKECWERKWKAIEAKENYN